MLIFRVLWNEYLACEFSQEIALCRVTKTRARPLFEYENILSRLTGITLMADIILLVSIVGIHVIVAVSHISDKGHFTDLINI